ncbi:elongation factor G [Sphingomonas sp. MAH-20]|uniref:Elongation factor G n=1 Tax=Sphingomonas horti TaxID=2682842 RepID=A0A6I4J1Q3_9SPHN|nr:MULTISPECIES: elongation factor G [Sphingomonas]MBA2918561.1 elongation factor G [Sphingomonas sp. CGMCC 1.13658]MVO78592.1 elongation factor G [Sphingomonas horti]
MPGRSDGTRAIALVGPGGAGKTSLAEALLFCSEAIGRQGSVDAGSCVGDSSPEARARRGSTELNLMHFDYLGDRFALVDSPGSVGFVADGALGVAACDLAVVVIDPEQDRAQLAEPALRQLEAMDIPHIIFVNKIDQARGRLRDLLEALQPLSAKPLLARHIPIWEGDRITGFVDVGLERAFHYVPGKPSERTEIPAELMDREIADRMHLLEQLADHDDALLEQLLMDETPDQKTVLSDLARETGDNLGVPVMFGSAQNGFGVRRLLKALRHEAPAPERAAERLGADGACALVFKVSNGNQIGRLALARVFGGALQEGAELNGTRVGTLLKLQGDKTSKVSRAEAGDVIAIAKLEGVQAGEWLTAKGEAPPAPAIERIATNHVVAIAPRNRNDDVKLSTALHKLTEEDGSLTWEQDEVHHETLLKGVGDEHLNVVLARLKRRYGVDVTSRPATIGYKESIRKTVTQRGRHKKQSGGHGQYGDCVIELRPLPRGSGFVFEDKITGGAIPRQYIPAVEAGIRDAMEKGPLGFPVVDVAVTLTDGSFHSVDSSELAFRTAGRIAMSEALAAAAPYLLEPIVKVTITAPNAATSRVTSAISSRRGQMLGMEPRVGWNRWDRIEALMPEASLRGLDAELRSLSQGLATYSAEFDHLQEISGKLADEVVHQKKELEAA